MNRAQTEQQTHDERVRAVEEKRANDRAQIEMFKALTCKWCGKPFEVAPHRTGSAPVFYSAPCRREAARGWRRAYDERQAREAEATRAQHRELMTKLDGVLDQIKGDQA